MEKSYIIGTYDKFDSWDRQHAVYKFEVNGNWYAVKEVEMEWGIPKLPDYIDRDMDREARAYHIYESKAEAMRFVHMIKGLN